MTTCKRIIPEITVCGGKAISGGREHICAELAFELYKSGADGILLNNVDKTNQGIAAMFRCVSEVSGRVFLPLMVSGAIYETAQLKIYVNEGADRVYYNSNGVRSPWRIEDSVKKLGKSYVAVTVDCRKMPDAEVFQVYISSAQVNAGRDAEIWINDVASRGVADVMVRACDHEGSYNHRYAVDLIKKLKKPDIPVLLRGDVIRCEDFVSAFDAGAQAVVSREITPENITIIKRELYKNGVNVRYDEI